MWRGRIQRIGEEIYVYGGGGCTAKGAKEDLVGSSLE